MRLSHLDDRGQVAMVDVSGKPVQQRVAVAQGRIRLQPSTLRQICDHTVAKGNVLTTAQLAGISAAKKTGELIPLCHPLMLSHIEVSLVLIPSGVSATATVKCQGITGVEMEALTAVSMALLTIYDMCKAVDKTMRIENIRLLKKTKT